MDKKNISYNQAIKEIEKIISKIENEDLEVDSLTEYVEKAADLIKICKDKLSKTEIEIEKIIKNIED